MGYKKICFIIPGLNAGGIENYLLRFLHFLPGTAGVTVMVKNCRPGDLMEEYKAAGVTIRFQSVGYLNPKKLKALHAFFKREKFDTVCDFTGNFSGMALYMASLAGVPNRISFYRRSSNAFKETFFNLVYLKLVNYLVYKYATRILSNSNFAFQAYFPYRSGSDARFKVIPNGVNPDTFTAKLSQEECRVQLGLPRNGFIVGHIGRYDKAKNHETIFAVARELISKNESIYFLFCGKDTDSEVFRERLRSYEIDKKVITLGLRKDLDVVLKTMDVFYFPSVTEGQPNALIEAIMAGLPVVASDILPIKEVIPGNGHRYLVNPLDQEGAAILIENIFKGEMDPAALVYKDDILSRFDLTKNLMLFQDEL